MGEKTMVGNYTILEQRRVGEVMIALGYNAKSPTPYATWKAYEHTNFQSFNGGNYFVNKKDAMVDYFRRLAEAWEYYVPDRPRQEQKPKQPKRGGMDR